MRIRLGLICAFIVAILSSAAAQTDYAQPLRKEHWSGGFFVGGGTGLGDRTNVEMFRAGGRIGRVMTGEIGGGKFRHTFALQSEWAPVDYTFWGGYKNVYGWSMAPIILTWNFVGERPRRVVPFAEAYGGVLFSKDEIPPGDTSKVNFTPGAGFGLHVFTRERQAMTFHLRAVHISNASLGDHNPGVNASMQFAVGYTWWKK
ncbi:MAG TPA: acyloxyacyl hydrolase [Clostridia bacterium]|nr:acyloxyacyl hydrolase [Clostridia bacterium]